MNQFWCSNRAKFRARAKPRVPRYAIGSLKILRIRRIIFFSSGSPLFELLVNHLLNKEHYQWPLIQQVPMNEGTTRAYWLN